LLNYGYRKLDDGSVAGYPAFWELGNRSGYKDMGFVENAKWKFNNNPVTTEEINRLVAADRRSLKVSEPVKQYATPEKFITVPAVNKYVNLFADSASADNAFWMTSEWVMEIKGKGAQNYLDFTGNFVNDPTVIKPIKISVYNYAADGNVADKPALVYYEYKSEKINERISFAGLQSGYYTIVVEDPVKIFRVAFSPSVSYSVVMRPYKNVNCTALFHSFLYVPVGPKNVTVSNKGTLE